MIRVYVRFAFSVGRSLPHPFMHMVAGLLLVAPFALLLRNAPKVRHAPAVALQAVGRAVLGMLLIPDNVTTPRRRALGKRPLSLVYSLGGPVDFLERHDVALRERLAVAKPKASKTAILLLLVAMLLPLGGWWASYDRQPDGAWRSFSERLFDRYEQVATWSDLAAEVMPVQQAR